jgi:hypothetical protein
MINKNRISCSLLKKAEVKTECKYKKRKREKRKNYPAIHLAFPGIHGS